MSEKLIQLLTIEAEEMATSYRKASIEGEGTPQEIADRREGVFARFIAKYFPFPYRIVKGNITDSYGASSNSIDCIVLNPSHPYTIDEKNERASIIMADGVDFAIEIKPDLANATEIERALKQIQSVKKLRRCKTGILSSSSKFSDKQIEYAKTVPGIIVADKTYSNVKLLVEKIYTYYRNNKVPKTEQFDLIMVNKSCLIFNFRNETYLTCDGREGIAVWAGGDKSLAGLLYMMNTFPRCEMLLSESIMKIYLSDLMISEVLFFPDLDKKNLNI